MEGVDTYDTASSITSVLQYLWSVPGQAKSSHAFFISCPI